MNFFIINPKDICNRVSKDQNTTYSEIVSNLFFVEKKFNIVKEIENADIAIFPRGFNTGGVFMEDIKNSNFYKLNKNKIYVFSNDDNDFPSFPGVYAAVNEKYMQLGWCAAGMYINAYMEKFNFEHRRGKDRDIFFSFVGSSATHPVRERILNLKHPNAVLLDSWKKHEEPWFMKSPSEINNKKAVYKQIVSRTKFALCPRGISPSSIRLFEVMEAGCVPVIISDNIILPKGPKWDEFAIRIKESDIQHIPKILESYILEFDRRSHLARRSWEEFFSLENRMNSLFGYFEEIHSHISLNRLRIGKIIKRDEIFLPVNIRLRARHLKAKYRV